MGGRKIRPDFCPSYHGVRGDPSTIAVLPRKCTSRASNPTGAFVAAYPWAWMRSRSSSRMSHRPGLALTATDGAGAFPVRGRNVLAAANPMPGPGRSASEKEEILHQCRLSGNRKIPGLFSRLWTMLLKGLYFFRTYSIIRFWGRHALSLCCSPFVAAGGRMWRPVGAALQRLFPAVLGGFRPAGAAGHP